MTVTEIANDLVSLCQKGEYEEAMTRYYADDILSVEPQGKDPEARGIAAVQEKTKWWVENMTVHSAEAFGPFVNGDQFVVEFKMDVTNKMNGHRMQMDEVGVYTVRDSKIVEERFFYHSGAVLPED